MRYDNNNDLFVQQVFTNAVDYSNLIIDFHYKYSNHDNLYSFFKISHD